MEFKPRVEGEVAGYVVRLRDIVLPKGQRRQVKERGEAGSSGGQIPCAGKEQLAGEVFRCEGA